MIPRLYVYLGIAAVLLAVGTFGGCRWQGAIDASKIERAEARAAKAAAALQAAETALRGAADRFRLIDAQTLANERAAAKAKAVAMRAAEDAMRDRNAAQARAASLERALEAERAGCVDGGRPICGVPLR